MDAKSPQTVTDAGMAVPEAQTALRGANQLPRGKSGHPGGKREQHGLYVRSVRGRKIRDRHIAVLALRLRATVPHLDRPEFAPITRRWSMREIMITEAFHNYVEKGMFNELGDVRRPIVDLLKMLTMQTKDEMEMGMTPASAAAIRTSLAGANGPGGLAGMAARHRKPKPAELED